MKQISNIAVKYIEENKVRPYSKIKLSEVTKEDLDKALSLLEEKGFKTLLNENPDESLIVLTAFMFKFKEKFPQVECKEDILKFLKKDKLLFVEDIENDIEFLTKDFKRIETLEKIDVINLFMSLSNILFLLSLFEEGKSNCKDIKKELDNSTTSNIEENPS